jgi:prepilin-type processing-associated H-X9-DG protein
VLINLSLFLPTLARGGPDEVLKPYVNDQTLIVARADFSRLDMAVVRSWLLDASRKAPVVPADADQVEHAIDAGLQQATQWITLFTKAGGRYVYVVADTSFEAPILLVPVEKDANPVAMEGILPQGGAYQMVQRENLILCAPSGRVPHLPLPLPSARPDIDVALGAGGDAPVVVVAVPSADVRRVLEQLVPLFPQELGGQPTAPLIHSLAFASFSVDTRPKVTLRMAMETADKQSAVDAAAALAAVIDAVRKNADLAREIPTAPAALALLKPVAKEKRVEIPLDQTAPALASMVIAAGMSARSRAEMVVSASDARQILVACHMYANENKGIFPASLQDALKAGRLGPNVGQIRNRPGATWTYIPPAPLNKLGAAFEHIVLHEPADPWPGAGTGHAGINVGFADGHVEWVADQKRFQELLEKTVERNKAK